MTNIDRLAIQLYGMKNRDKIIAALDALLPIIKAAKEEGRQEALLEALKEGGLQDERRA